MTWLPPLCAPSVTAFSGATSLEEGGIGSLLEGAVEATAETEGVPEGVPQTKCLTATEKYN